MSCPADSDSVAGLLLRVGSRGCIDPVEVRPLRQPSQSGTPPTASLPSFAAPRLLPRSVWRWSCSAVDNIADCHEEFLLASGQTHAAHPGGRGRCILESVRSVGRDIQGRTRPDRGFLATERELRFAFKQREHFLEIVPVWRRPAAGRHVHVDQPIPAVGLCTADQNRISVTRNRNVLHLWGVRICDG